MNIVNAAPLCYIYVPPAPLHVPLETHGWLTSNEWRCFVIGHQSDNADFEGAQ